MKNVLLTGAIALLFGHLTFAQDAIVSNKPRVYGEVGMGFGQTLFGSGTKGKLTRALGGGFDAGTGGNLMLGFYVAPQTWRGLGIGGRVKGTFGSGVAGDFGDSYIFNYYAVSATAKYFAGGTFNKGLYGRASLGFGQFTSKRQNEETNLYIHQYAIGNTLALGVGYAIPFGKQSLGFEVEWETSNRNGTVNGQGEVSFRSGQIGGNVILSF
jgi:hypothetical protein